MGFLSSLFKRATEMIVTTAPWERQARWFAPNTLNYIREGYKRHELVYACIRKLALTTSEATLRVYDRKEQEIANHPLRLLLQRPNGPLKFSEYDFWELTVTMLYIAGACYWEKERASRRNVVGLWPLRPDLVSPVPGVRGIDHYIVRDGSGGEEAVPEEDILRFSFVDPESPYGHQSPLAVVARQVNVDLEMQTYVKLMFQNWCVPRGLLTTSQKLMDADARDIKARWKEQLGGDNRGDLAVLDKDAKYQEIGTRIGDLGLGELTNLSEARICQVFGVPPILVGALVGLERSTYSNYEQAKISFWHETVLPLYKKLADTINEEMEIEYGAGAVAEWDLSGVWALQQEMWQQRRFWLEAMKVGGATVNEFRTESQLEEVPGGDVLLWPANLVPQPAAPKKAVVPVRGKQVPSPLLLETPAANVEASEAEEWAMTPQWMQDGVHRFESRLRDVLAEQSEGAYEAILAIPEDEWNAASGGGA